MDKNVNYEIEQADNLIRSVTTALMEVFDRDDIDLGVRIKLLGCGVDLERAKFILDKAKKVM